MDTTKILTDNSNEHIFDQNKQKTRKIKQEKLHYTLKNIYESAQTYNYIKTLCYFVYRKPN